MPIRCGADLLPMTVAPATGLRSRYQRFCSGQAHDSRHAASLPKLSFTLRSGLRRDDF
jgi:hypothetical protein